ncbi:outer membrane beta-barrel protein [Helicobacter acinonychis]|uniref:OMP442 n=1 Tax=Helicobacter acinonychis TaxID=212 RepID=A0A1M4NGM3_HELAC|nr:outer membrane beta-barrel protein [Helicobacter acinonychis]SFZ70394.1 OMP753 [Helicobacter acinonychis]SFZ70709.1 OMP442 [Helicobacter acinonychis]STP03362.1 outer membrane protein [Helicobacter acinonychis]
MKILFIVCLFLSLNPLFLEANEITWSQFLENFKNKDEPKKPKKPTTNEPVLDKNQQILKSALEKSLKFFFIFGYNYSQATFSTSNQSLTLVANSIGFNTATGLEHFLRNHPKIGFRVFSAYNYFHSVSLSQPQILMVQNYGGGLDFSFIFADKKPYRFRSYLGIALEQGVLLVDTIRPGAITTIIPRTKKTFFQAPFRFGFIVDFIGYLSLQLGIEMPLVRSVSYIYNNHQEKFKPRFNANLSLVVSF